MPAAGTSVLFAVASFAVSRLDGLETCAGGESGSSTATRCNIGFPKIANNTTTAAATAARAIRPIASNPSSRRAGGSGTGSGLKDLSRRSGYSSLSEGTVEAVLTSRGRSASGVAGCWRDHLGAYFLSSKSVSSSLGALIITPYAYSLARFVADGGAANSPQS